MYPPFRPCQYALLLLCFVVCSSCNDGEVSGSDQETYEVSSAPQSIFGGKDFGILMYNDVGNVETVNINRISVDLSAGVSRVYLSSLRPGVPRPKVGEIRNLFQEDGKLSDQERRRFDGYNPLVVTNSSFDYTFPEGIALNLTRNEKLDIALLGKNSTPEKLKVRSGIKAYRTKATITKEANPFYFVNTQLYVQSFSPGRQARTFTVRRKMNIFMIKPFTGKFTTHFEVSIVGGRRNGEVIYSAEDWRDQRLTEFREPVVLGPGHGLRMTVTYANTSDRPVMFGLRSEDDFSGIFGYYY